MLFFKFHLNQIQPQIQIKLKFLQYQFFKEFIIKHFSFLLSHELNILHHTP